jgi:hypothetical protein
MTGKFEYVNGAEMATAVAVVIKNIENLCYYDLQTMQDVAIAYGKNSGSEEEKAIWKALEDMTQKEICKQ